MGSPWFRLQANMHADAKLRRARARTIWPWVLCRLKDGDGLATEEDLDAGICADDHDGLTEDACAEMLSRLKQGGLLVEVEDGLWTTPMWGRYQSDPTAAERMRRYRARQDRVTPVTVTGVTDNNGTKHTQDRYNVHDRAGQNSADAQALDRQAHASEGTVTVTCVSYDDGTGRDGTGQDNTRRPAETTRSVDPPFRQRESADHTESTNTKAKPAALRVYAAWAEAHDKTRTMPDSSIERDKERIKYVEARLKGGYTEAELIQAVQFIARSEWHQSNGQTELVSTMRKSNLPGVLERVAAEGNGQSQRKRPRPESEPPPILEKPDPCEEWRRQHAAQQTQE